MFTVVTADPITCNTTQKPDNSVGFRNNEFEF